MESTVSPAISVIVTSFNAETTLARTLDSILGQTFVDLELLVVDDGSSDGTTGIVRDYTLKDRRVRLVEAEHLGVAAARQKGIDLANGAFTIFVDADDWIEPTMLEESYNQAGQECADIVICDIRVIRRNSVETDRQAPESRSGKELIPALFGKLHGSLCNKLIRKSCYTQGSIAFLPGLNCCEDLLVVLRMMESNPVVAYVGKPLYNYDKTRDSITNQWIEVPVREKVRFLDEAAPIADRNGAEQAFDNYTARLAYNALFASRTACPNYRKLLLKYKNRILSSNLPAYKKWLIRMYLLNLRLPLRGIKMKRIRNKRNG